MACLGIGILFDGGTLAIIGRHVEVAFVAVGVQRVQTDQIPELLGSCSQGFLVERQYLDGAEIKERQPLLLGEGAEEQLVLGAEVEVGQR